MNWQSFTMVNADGSRDSWDVRVSINDEEFIMVQSSLGTVHRSSSIAKHDSPVVNQ